MFKIQMDGMSTITRALTPRQVFEIIRRCFAEQTECRIENERGEPVGVCWEDNSQETPWNYYVDES